MPGKAVSLASTPENASEPNQPVKLQLRRRCQVPAMRAIWTVVPPTNGGASGAVGRVCVGEMTSFTQTASESGVMMTPEQAAEGEEYSRQKRTGIVDGWQKASFRVSMLQRKGWAARTCRSGTAQCKSHPERYDTAAAIGHPQYQHREAREAAMVQEDKEQEQGMMCSRYGYISFCLSPRLRHVRIWMSPLRPSLLMAEHR